jgi:DNA polymerase-4
LTRQRLLNEPSDVAQTLLSAGTALLREFDHPGPFRLVGMAAFDLISQEGPEQLGLFQEPPRRRKLEMAIDRLTERFGADIVRRAEDLTCAETQRIDATLDFLDDDDDPDRHSDHEE